MRNSQVIHCDVVVIIVDFFKGERVRQNVAGLLDQNIGSDIQVCIVDNSCDAHNRALLLDLGQRPNVHLIFNDENAGYTKACNQAAERFAARYVVLANPDIAWVRRETLSELVNLMDSDTRLAIAGPRQVNDDGTTPDTVRGFPDILAQIARRTVLRNMAIFRNKVRRYECADFDYSKSQYVDWIQSSLLIVRGEFWERVGGLDTEFFLFMSDPEICFRAWEMGYKVFYSAETVVGADGRRCSAGGVGQIFRSRAMRYHIRDALVYQLRHLFRTRPQGRR